MIGREYQGFWPKHFCLSLPKIFIKETFRVSLNSDVEKVYECHWVGGREAVSNFYVDSFLSHSTKKLHERTLRALVQKTSGFEKVREKRGE